MTVAPLFGIDELFRGVSHITAILYMVEIHQALCLTPPIKLLFQVRVAVGLDKYTLARCWSDLIHFRER